MKYFEDVFPTGFSRYFFPVFACIPAVDAITLNPITVFKNCYNFAALE